MNKKTTIFGSAIILSAAVVAIATISFDRSGNSLSLLRAVTPGPEETISSVAFYENSDIEAIYGKSTGAASGYKAEQTVNISGGTWIISGASYGEDEPTHITATLGRNTLFYDAIWLADSILPFNTDYAGMTYSDEYDSMKTNFNSALRYNIAIFSTTTFTNVKDFGFFFHYATDNLGIKPFYKVAGTNDWLPLIGSLDYEGDGKYNIYSFGNGLTIYENGASAYNAELRQETIDGAPGYNRYYDGACYYNDEAFKLLDSKEVYLGFLIGASQNYLMDIQIDGVIVNRHDSAMKFMNSLNGKEICGEGSITDENIKMCFELFDKAFDTASSSSSDVDDLSEYSINHSKYPNLREADYLSQYQFLKSKLA